MPYDNQYGWDSAVNNAANQGLTEEQVLDLIRSYTKSLKPVRVLDIVLDETSELFGNVQGWNALGAIRFEYVETAVNRQKQSFKIAYPLLSNIKQYPLENEIVYIIDLPSTKIGENDNAGRLYYVNTVALWNHPHHNAYPNPNQGNEKPSENHDYQQIEGGLVRRVTDGDTDISLNGESRGTFREQTNIKPLLPFAGDYIVEGRFGNSIRLGNTSKTNSIYKNNWSDVGENGNPITIIKNGQPDNAGEEGWLPITENINNDKSSIYLTSNQKIPLIASSENYSAFKNAPDRPRLYTSNQIILSSGRLVLNASSDSVLISSQKDISLSSQMNIGLTSIKDISLVGNFIRLGSNSANQPLVKGDAFMARFETLLSNLMSLCDTLEQATFAKIGITGQLEIGPHPTISVIAPIVRDNLGDIKNEIPSLLSQVSKTI